MSSTRSTQSAVSGTWILYDRVSEQAVCKYVPCMRFDVMRRPYVYVTVYV